jgi:precorrin-2 dehydrogenase / sirohydrochlorin ferrochelatase
VPALLASKARLHVVSPEALPEIVRLARDGKIKWSKRLYRSSDLKDVRLVIAATDDPQLQKRISKQARAKGIWTNVVDVPPLCDFIAPAIVKRGDIQIAISTGGAAPALAKYLRKKLEGILGPELEDFVDMVKKIRPRILRLPKAERMALWERLVNDSFLMNIRRHGIAQARKQLARWTRGAE